MKIKNKLYMSAGISIILVVIFVSMVLVTSGRIAEGNKKHELADDVYKGISELDLVTYDYLLHREERMEQQWNLRYNSLREVLVGAVEEVEEKSIRIDYAALGDLFSQVIANNKEIQNLIQEGASQEKIDAATGLEERLVAQLLITSHSIITDASRLAEGAQAEVTEAQRLGTILTSALTVILVVTVSISSLLIARGISKPLDALTKGAEVIGEGDLEHRVAVKSKDELGELADAFNLMIARRQRAEEKRQQLTHDLGERVKELNCLYSIFKLVEKPDISLEEIFQDTVELIPPAWQYPEITCAMLTMYGFEYSTENFKETIWSQSSDSYVKGDKVGKLIVCYLGEKPEIDEGPFLKEERTLIDAITEHLGKTIERIQAEEELFDKSTYLDNILTSATEYAIATTDLDFRINYYNPMAEKLHGFKAEEVIGKTVQEMHTGEKVEPLRFERAIENVNRTGEHRYSRIIETEEGTQHIDVRVSGIYAPNGELVGYANFARDITERVKAEEAFEYSDHLERMVKERTAQLESANKELEAFSYSVSHDLRAPLRAVDGFSCILLDEHAATLPTSAQRYLGLVRKNAQQMGQLIEDLLAFSRLSRSSLEKKTVEPTDVVRQALESLHGEQEDRHIEISISDLPPCNADPALLKQVYINLLSNALKFTNGREVARIEVGCQPMDGEQVYFVRDNGVGFDMRYVDKLFGVFQRLHRADDYEGTGVGLAIVHRIIHRHGGRVWAEAQVDEGATFSFTI